jgi:hypothetical protein
MYFSKQHGVYSIDHYDVTDHGDIPETVEPKVDAERTIYQPASGGAMTVEFGYFPKSVKDGD